MSSLEDQKQEREIAGVRYEVWPLQFSAGKKILLKIIRAVTSAGDAVNLGQLAQVHAILTAMTDDDIRLIGDSFGDAARFWNGENMAPLIAKNQEMHFAGKIDVFLEWVMFAIEVNYGGFFDGQRRMALASAAAKLTIAA